MWLRTVVLIVVAAAFAHAQPTVAPQFEVASIKPNHSGIQGFDGFTVDHGSLTVRNVSLKMLIEAAYGVQAERIIEGPTWLGYDHFDVSVVDAALITR